MPFAVLDPGSTDRQTREGGEYIQYWGSIAFLNYILHKYAFENFGIRQVAPVLGESSEVEYYTNRCYMSANISIFHDC